MGPIDEVLARLGDKDTVNVTIVSNQDNGIASYAIGGLVFHSATNFVIGGPPYRPARLESNPGQPFKMFFSDRRLVIDPPPTQDYTFQPAPTQPFNANETENLGVSISLGGSVHVMHLTVFNSRSVVMLSPMGDLLVGLGPSLGHSAAGVFVVAFTGVGQIT